MPAHRLAQPRSEGLRRTPAQIALSVSCCILGAPASCLNLRASGGKTSMHRCANWRSTVASLLLLAAGLVSTPCSAGGVLISDALTIRPDAAENSPRLRGIRQFSATILPAEKYPRLRRANFTPSPKRAHPPRPSLTTMTPTYFQPLARHPSNQERRLQGGKQHTTPLF